MSQQPVNTRLPAVCGRQEKGEIAKKVDEKKAIINRINKIAGKYSAYEVFTDWIRCSALAMSNAVTDAGTEGNVGAVLKNIPAQLLDLKIEHMSPDSLGSSDDMHGYRFDCYVQMWFGIPGEHDSKEN